MKIVFPVDQTTEGENGCVIRFKPEIVDGRPGDVLSLSNDGVMFLSSQDEHPILSRGDTKEFVLIEPAPDTEPQV